MVEQLTNKIANKFLISKLNSITSNFLAGILDAISIGVLGVSIYYCYCLIIGYKSKIKHLYFSFIFYIILRFLIAFILH